MRIPLITRIIDAIHVHSVIIKNTKQTVSDLSEKIGERSFVKYENIQKAREYIFRTFTEYCADPEELVYEIEGRTFANISAEIKGYGSLKNEIIIIGAHYDTVEGSRGANDNASGIAALFELYKILSMHKLRRTVRFVAFTLEEPPFFDSPLMGSFVYAEQCLEKKEKIALMISLDMLGFGGRFVKQDYPLDEMKKKFPANGNFISVVTLPCYSPQAFLFKKVFNHYSKIKIVEFVAPASVAGIALSDHLSFHKLKIPSLMVSDTGLYRNENYHTEKDTIDTLNFRFLAVNIVNIGHTLRDLVNSKKLPQEN